MKEYKKSQFNPSIINQANNLIYIFSPYEMQLGNVVTFNNRTITGLIVRVLGNNYYVVDTRLNVYVEDCQYKDLIKPKVLTTQRLIGLAEFPKSYEDLELDIPLIVKEPHEEGTIKWELIYQQRLIVKGTDYLTPRRIYYTEPKRAFNIGNYQLNIRLITSIGLVTMRAKTIEWNLSKITNKLEYKSLIKLEIL